MEEGQVMESIGGSHGLDYQQLWMSLLQYTDVSPRSKLEQYGKCFLRS